MRVWWGKYLEKLLGKYSDECWDTMLDSWSSQFLFANCVRLNRCGYDRLVARPPSGAYLLAYSNSPSIHCVELMRNLPTATMIAASEGKEEEITDSVSEIRGEGQAMNTTLDRLEYRIYGRLITMRRGIHVRSRTSTCLTPPFSTPLHNM